MPAIETNGLTKRYKDFNAVDSLSLKIEEGEVFGLLGPNGAGKTTTLRMLSCLISPTDGAASVSGFDIKKEPSNVRQTIGVLTENPSLYERLTAVENMEFFAEAYGMANKEERSKRIDELLAFFNLTDRKNDKVSTFSKGMKQKLAIAKAIVHKPKILFLDEPTANLDPEASREIRNLIKTLSQQEKCTVLICTHHLEDAEKICSRVMIMDKGRMIIVGTPGELREKITGEPFVKIALKSVDETIVNAAKSYHAVRGIMANDEESVLAIQVDNAKEAVPEIVKSIVNANGEILSVEVLRPSLEDAYLKLVKGENK